MTQRIVVVGGGIATVRLVETLRRLGSDADVIVVAAESHDPYDRPPLSKAFLQGADDAPPYLRGVSDYTEWKADLQLGRRAARLRPGDRAVELDDGTELFYDELVIATGAEPRLLPEVGRDKAHVLRSYDDASRLRAAMHDAARIVIVGAGFIGCEVAASARRMGLDVTLVDLLAAPLVRILGDSVSAEVARMHEAAGVDLRMQTTLAEQDDLVDAPVILVAVGVMPATGWLDGSGVDVDDGVVCDASGHASRPGVWAMGDVASWLDEHTGRHRRYEHWTSAGDQAVVVAHNLVNGASTARTLTEVPYFWSDQYDVKLQSLGTPTATDDVRLLTVGPRNRLLAVYGSQGRVTGVVGFGVARQVMRMRALLAARASYADAVAAAAAGDQPA